MDKLSRIQQNLEIVSRDLKEASSEDRDTIIKVRDELVKQLISERSKRHEKEDRH
jgi:hypothetical protein